MVGRGKLPKPLRDDYCIHNQDCSWQCGAESWREFMILEYFLQNVESQADTSLHTLLWKWGTIKVRKCLA
ncbi:hypothetical protein Y1Q_0016196 [Alligator mississippiensis]|uniref:Uncharacterized protein n=1 Tax=Alligator mississippiensis TaxID=8496 RepID=A0A151P164_ALLMI|nr:hypothetical protein Y1Q_0016196 [Alligator mississippiensis]